MKQVAMQQTVSFDLTRLSKSKAVVDLAPNTLRKYFALGLNSYQRGKTVFFSRAELAAFIREWPARRPGRFNGSRRSKTRGKQALAA